jgi:hypothetical protein
MGISDKGIQAVFHGHSAGRGKQTNFQLLPSADLPVRNGLNYFLSITTRALRFTDLLR